MDTNRLINFTYIYIICIFISWPILRQSMLQSWGKNMRDEFDKFSNRKYSHFECFKGEFAVHWPIIAAVNFCFSFIAFLVYLPYLSFFFYRTLWTEICVNSSLHWIRQNRKTLLTIWAEHLTKWQRNWRTSVRDMRSNCISNTNWELQFNNR